MRNVFSGAGDRIGAGVRTVLSPAGISGTAVELAWLVTHLALYPGGLAAERLREHDRFTVADLPPLKRALMISNLEAAGTPVLLVHGLVDNRSVFTLLRRGLRRRGFGRVVSMNYSPLTHDIRAAATQLAERVEELCDQTGYERIHVIGHSLGGLIARYYVQCLGGDDRVDTLVTLGAPHGGTAAAHLVPHPLIRQLRPSSEIMAELRAPAPQCRTRFVAFYSDIDHLVLPAANGRIDHPDLRARNLLMAGIGHTSLPARGKVVHAICTMLAHLDHDGSCQSPGHVDQHPERPSGHSTNRATNPAENVTPITSGAANSAGQAPRLSTFTSSVRQTVGPA